MLPPGRPAAASRRPPKCTNLDRRPPPGPTGPLPTPTCRIRSPRPRPARDSRPPHASRPRSTPASRHARANPVRPRAGPARQQPFADSSEPYRSHRARTLSTHGSVSSCRMPLSRSSAYISRPGLAGPADALESRPRSGSPALRCAPGEDPAAAHIRCVPCLCRRWELVGVDDVRGSLCESPPAARRLRTTAGRRVIMRAVIAVASSACSRFVDGRPERRPSDRLSGAAPAPRSCSNRCVGAGSMRGPRGRARAMTRAGGRGSD